MPQRIDEPISFEELRDLCQLQIESTMPEAVNALAVLMHDMERAKVEPDLATFLAVYGMSMAGLAPPREIAQRMKSIILGWVARDRLL